MDFSDVFYYDETSPSGLRWKVFNRAIMPKNKRYPGDVAEITKLIKQNQQSITEQISSMSKTNSDTIEKILTQSLKKTQQK